MDAIVLTDALVAVGTGTASADHDISNRVRKLTWNREFEDHDTTTMGSTNRAHTLGLGDHSMDLELLQSYSTADGGENVDNLLNTLLDLSASGQNFLVRVRAKNAAIAASNPEYSSLMILQSHTILDGEVGAALMEPVTLLSAGDVTRSTATT